MIYEFRTYDLKPRTLSQYDTILKDALSGGRREYSRLFGYWYTEFGPLNQALHVWPYNDLNERAEIRQKVNGVGNWPPATASILAAQAADIYYPAPFNDESIVGDHGPYYELRIYDYSTGEIPAVIDAWSKAIDERRKHSTFVGAWYSEFGGLNKWAHMWAYKSLEERDNVRSEMIAKKIWPAPGGPAPKRQESRLFKPFSFSPLK